MQGYFEDLADILTGLLHPGEVFTCHFQGEDSQYVRLNRNRVRQALSVQQRELAVDLIQGQRHATGSLHLGGRLEGDRQRLKELVETLRAQRTCLDDDPHLYYATERQSSREEQDHTLPDAAEAVDAARDAAGDMDLVGIWSSGPLYAGFANSLGQRNWFRTASFAFDWSCYHDGDKAVKSTYAGVRWEPGELRHRMARAREQLEVMARPPKTIEPGRYRVYLAPSALNEVLGMVAWGGFGLKSHRTAQTPLIRMVREGQHLHPGVSLQESQAAGLTPSFTAEGFPKPNRVSLIEQGEYRDCLVSPRSSQEYGRPVNADGETPQSLDMAPGDIPLTEVLGRLGEGLYINHLWYSNFSDRNDCRITAMTRFACFWVQNGEIIAPVNVMRLDESVYNMLGRRLIGLTRERELMADTGTYERRSTASMRLPGALIEDFTFTL